jgi:hypothetical protein
MCRYDPVDSITRGIMHDKIAGCRRRDPMSKPILMKILPNKTSKANGGTSNFK